MKWITALLVWVLALAGGVSAQEFTASSRLNAAESGAQANGNTLVIELSMSQSVPYRVFTLDAPKRLVLDFREIDWTGFDPTGFTRAGAISDARAGRYQENWSRLVLTLTTPMKVGSAIMTVDAAQTAQLLVTLEPTDAENFAALAGAPDTVIWGEAEPVEAAPAITRQTGDRPLVVVLDPGHGGIDPGAERGEIKEADLMLQFARILKEELLRAGNFEVVLTREEDHFVSLDRRVSIARAARADLFLSLHADALPEGNATGATVYTLSEDASDAAAQILSERHDREDLLAGVDLSHHDDVVASVLIDLARTETHPRNLRLAAALIDSIRDAGGRVHKRPHQQAAFSVLKAPDIPSVLIELGFLSSDRDFDQLIDESWQAATAAAIRTALQNWAVDDAAEALLLRQ